MRARSDDRITERLIELSVARQLAADAHPNFGNAFGPAILMDPFHQGPADPAALVRGIDGHATDLQVIRVPLEPQARDGSAVKRVQETVIAIQVLTHVVFGLP